MKSTGLKAAVIVPCLLLASCDQALSAKGPTTVVTRDNTEGVCTILIKIDADSNITINGDAISLDELTSQLKNRPEDAFCSAVVQADKDVDAKDFVRILNTIDAASPQE